MEENRDLVSMRSSFNSQVTHRWNFASHVQLGNANRLLFGLIFFELFLVLVFLADSLLGSPIWIVHSLFDLDQELNIPTWFSSIQLFLIGITFFLIARQTDSSHHPSALFLTVVGVVFVFLSADEASSIHEKLTMVASSREWFPKFKGGHGSWIPIYLGLCLIFFFTAYRELKAMWTYFQPETLMIATGIAVFLFGAVVLEIISYQFLRDGATPLLYLAEVAFEEFLEMSGGSLILYGTIRFAMNFGQEQHLPRG